MLSVDRFVGFANFATAFKDPRFWNALSNTLKYCIYFLPANLVLALLIALALNAVPRGKAFYRVIYFLPPITSTVAISLIWRYMYDRDVGLFNQIIHLVAPSITPAWLANGRLALGAVAAVAIWQETGYNALLCLAGLQGIPIALYEAARIDGANAWKGFRWITWPLLRPTFTFVLITSFVGAIQVFSSIYVMTQGRPVPYMTETLVYYIYTIAFLHQKLGYAAALSGVQFALLLTFAVLQFRLMRTTWKY